MFGFFKKKLSPYEMYKRDKGKSPTVSTSKLKKGATRQWKRLHDPEFQAKEMIDTLNRIVPPKK